MFQGILGKQTERPENNDKSVKKGANSVRKGGEIHKNPQLNLPDVAIGLFALAIEFQAGQNSKYKDADGSITPLRRCIS